MGRILLNLVSASLLFTTQIDAQVTGGAWFEHVRLDGDASYSSGFGRSIDGQSDFDGDGVLDIVVGIPEDERLGYQDSGAVDVYSGATGQLIRSFTVPLDGSNFGWRVASGDLDGDGIGDLVVTMPNWFIGAGPQVHAYSGATGDNLYVLVNYDVSVYGESLDVVDDRDGDGTPDLLIGSPSYSMDGPFRGMVELRSGATGALLARWEGTEDYGNLGYAVVETGDITRDGVGEFVFGAPGYGDQVGAFVVIDGASHQVMTRISVSDYGTFQQLGSAVADAGDVNGDGYPDLLVGANVSANNLSTYAGRAYVFSGRERFSERLYDIPGYLAGIWFGYSLAGAGDVNQDGFDDFLVGAHGGAVAGSVSLYSGADGTLLKRVDGTLEGPHMGDVVAAGDLNGDGDCEFLAAGLPSLGSSAPGQVRAIGLDGFLQVDAEEWSVSGTQSLRFELNFPVSEAGMPYRLLASASGIGPRMISGVQVPLGLDWLLRDSLRGRLPRFVSGASGVLDAAGRAHATLSGRPFFAGLVGRTYHFAAVTTEADLTTGRLSSIAQRITVVP